MKKKAKVSVIRTAVDYSGVEAAVEEAVELAGCSGIIEQAGKNILIKPNLVDLRDGESGSTTDRRIVGALIKTVGSAGSNAIVGDSSGLRWHGATEQVLKQTGMREYCENTGAEVVSFDATEPVRLEIPEGRILKEIHIAKPVVDSDIFINVPKMKTHILTTITGATKNIFGCVPGGQKSYLHSVGFTPNRFASLIVDIYSVIKPDVSVMDAVVGLGGMWRDQDIIRPGLILAGEDAIAVDAVMARYFGLHPLMIDLLKIAHDRGLGTADLDEIEIVGVKPEELYARDRERPKIFTVPALGISIARLLLGKERPVLNRKMCSKCDNCRKACPVDAITMIEGMPQFDLDKCIRCFCCLELCPQRAVGFKRGLLGNLFLR
jgi:uncharacterized protein (DUF362 family)/Pyruvate/2-oxoacid:ferredoxin oxidoreductase delta subunit